MDWALERNSSSDKRNHLFTLASDFKLCISLLTFKRNWGKNFVCCLTLCCWWDCWEFTPLSFQNFLLQLDLCVSPLCRVLEVIRVKPWHHTDTAAHKCQTDTSGCLNSLRCCYPDKMPVASASTKFVLWHLLCLAVEGWACIFWLWLEEGKYVCDTETACYENAVRKKLLSYLKNCMQSRKNAIHLACAAHWETILWQCWISPLFSVSK